MEDLTVSIEDGFMIIRIKMQEPAISGSGKSYTIASTHGNTRVKTEFQGKPITIGLNAYVKK